MKKIIVLIVLLLLAMLAACGGSQDSDTQNIDLNNVLSLGYADGLAKHVITCEHVVDSVDIDFGCFLKSGDASLIPQNNSDYELTDIKIAIDNPQFEVSPARIASIGAPDKSTGSIPVIRVSVNHRSPLNALTETDPLPVGENIATITVTGLVQGQEFTVKTTVGVYAEALDVVQRDDGSMYLKGPMLIDGKRIDSTDVDIFYDSFTKADTVNFKAHYRVSSDFVFFYADVEFPAVFGTSILKRDNETYLHLDKEKFDLNI